MASSRWIVAEILDRIKEILSHYPDDGQILRELIQNAEDAKATCVKFLYDKSQYTTTGLKTSEHDKYRGEALYVYNDATFSEDDFMKLTDTRIKKHMDKMKVGRFGLGFKSVFHMTDCPVLLSGEYLKTLSLDSPKPEKHSELYKTHPAELECFLGKFGYTRAVAENGHFPGTIFRFPLRKEPSDISKTLYGEEKIRELFRALEDHGFMNLLFLKSLQTIEVYTNDALGGTPKLKFCINLVNTDPNVLTRRLQFFQDLQRCDGQLVNEERCLAYPLTIQTCDSEPEQFLICHYYTNKPEDISQTMATLLTEKTLCHLPLASVAMPLENGANGTDSRPTGHIFCFLPLPIHDTMSPTGLPVHVSSNFAVSSNRSEVKWPISGQDPNKMADDLKWNQCVIKELVPRAYCRLLLEATKLRTVQNVDICKMFPNMYLVDEKWRATFLPIFLQRVCALPIFPVIGQEGCYRGIKDAVFCPPALGSECQEVIVKVLKDAGRCCVSVPEHVLSAVKTCAKVMEATPTFVCGILEQCSSYTSYSRNEKLVLLQYLLIDPAFNIADLHGIHLLPLANGKFEAFSSKGQTKIFIDDHDYRSLLPTLEYRFLATDLESNLRSLLCQERVLGYTQLTMCTDQDVLSLLCEVFPKSVATMETIFCRSEDASLCHLTPAWLEKLWSFLSSSPHHFERLKHLHILPIENDSSGLKLTKISGGKICVLRHHGYELLPEHVASVLSYFDILVVDSLPDIISRHPLIFKTNSIYQPNAKSLVDAMLKAYQKNTQVKHSFNMKATEVERRAILGFLSSLNRQFWDPSWKALLGQLELFDTLAGSGGQQKHSASSASVPMAVESYSIPVKSSKLLLDVSSPEAKQLAQWLGIRILDERATLTDCIFEDIRQQTLQQAEVVKVMKYVLQRSGMYSQDIDSFRTLLDGLPFLSDKTGAFHLPSDMFDRADPTLLDLFSGEDVFPENAYAEHLNELRVLELKGTEHVTSDDLLRVARRIDQDVRSGEISDCIERKSKGIAGIVSKFPERHKAALVTLNGLHWVPVQQQRPSSYPDAFPWFQSGLAFEKPCSIGLSHQAVVVGSAMPIVKSSDILDAVLDELLGQQYQPPLSKVVAHLKNITNADSIDHSRYKDDTIRMVKEIYKLLSRHQVGLVQAEMKVQSVSQFVWHGDGFAPPELVTTDTVENMSPYLYKLPPELIDQERWLNQMGVMTDYNKVALLHRIKFWHDEQNGVSKERKLKDLDIVVKVLKKITESPDVDQMLNKDQILLLPVENDQQNILLLPMSACTCPNQEWSLQQLLYAEDASVEDDSMLHFVHHCIPKEILDILGVKSTMNRFLEGSSEGFSCVAGHGQELSLTDSLKRQLKDYPDGLAIPKELIQNADDAGATEVRFLYDERENPVDRLLDEGMRDCQGPALWVYNNEEFSKEDLANIRKLSGATKEEKKDKIGKFGLGFSAVYNITDVPSFVTGDHLVIFDPHRTHLGKAMPRGDTGLILNICSPRLAKIRFNDQFQPYHGIFGCQILTADNQQRYKGTLFRLPLRPVGSRSKISNMPYTKSDMTELFQMLIDQAQQFLLFTQNVRKIGVYHLPSDGDPMKPVEIFQTDRETNRELKAFPKTLTHSVSDSVLCIAAKLLDTSAEQVDSKDVSRARVIETKMTWGSSRGSDLHLQGESSTETWLTVDCIGTEGSFKQAKRSKSCVPVAGAAVKLQQIRSQYQVVPFEGNSAPVFCFLPLPSSVKSGLPVIVNGSFAVQPDRRNIVAFTKDDKGTEMSLWNEALKKDAVVKAYVKTLERLTEITNESYDSYSLWPVAKKCQQGFESFCQSFISSVVDKRISPKLFTDGKVWVDFQHVWFLPGALTMSKELKPIALLRMQKWLDMKHPGSIVSVQPKQLSDHFPEVKAKINSMSDFYRDAVIPYIHELAPAERDKLILFALDHVNQDSALKSLIEASHCIPVQPKGGKLLCPKDVVSPQGSCGSLYDAGDHVFPMECYLKQNYHSALKSLGMRYDEMTWEMLVERAESVCKLPLEGQDERTQQWIRAVERELTSYKSSPPNTEMIIKLKEIQFLPVLQKPTTFPIFWKGEDLYGERLAAKDLYPISKQNLLGHTCYILDENRLKLNLGCQKALALLELDRDIPLDDVLVQMKALSAAPITVTNQASVRTMCSEIYRHLEDRCQNPSLARKIADDLQGTSCILTGNCMVLPQHCAMTGPDIPPLMCKMSWQLSYRNLLPTLGVKVQFSGIDFIDALHRILPGSHQKIPGPSIKIVRAVAESLCEWLHKSGQSVENLLSSCQGKDILLPSESDADGNSELLPVSHLCISSAPWLENTVASKDIKFVHRDIPVELALQLGVKSDRESLLQKLGYGIIGEAFGQKEELTTRLRNILEGYPCDEGVLKELLQNADDARAQELRFILDTRGHKGERVFTDEWEDLQGPALCVFNDRGFTTDDLDGICKLGQGSKSSDTTKTGQYGIGFNCVYHLTDVPSFVTRVDGTEQTLAVLDPNSRYAPGACDQNPGRCFKGKDFQTVRENFPDVLSAYPQALQDIVDHDDATIFRLPLRTRKMAEVSKISKKAFEVKEVERLLESFKREMFPSLLFVNSVRKISVEAIGGSFQKYEVQASISREDQLNLERFNSYVHSVALDLKNRDKALDEIENREVLYTRKMALDEIEYREVVYTLKMVDSKQHEETWLICQCIGFKGDDIPESVSNASQSGGLGLLPRGGAAVCLSRTSPSTHREAKDAHRFFCFLPVPSPHDTKIPVHVNGHFALDSSRRSLWEDSHSSRKGNSYRSDWNSLVMSTVVARAYAALVENRCQHLQSKNCVDAELLQALYKVFPNYDKESSVYIRDLVRGLYHILLDKDVKCLAVQTERTGDGVRWFSIKDCVEGITFFDNLTRRAPRTQPVQTSRHLSFPGYAASNTPATPGTDEDHTLTRILCRIGFNLLASPMSIYQSLRSLKIMVLQVEPKTVLQYLYDYKNHQDCYLRNLPIDVSATPLTDKESVVAVLTYCFRQITSESTDVRSLHGLPLCVSEAGILQEFSSREQIFKPQFMNLLPSFPGIFLDKDVYRAIPQTVRAVNPFCLKQLRIEDLAEHMERDETFQILVQTYRLQSNLDQTDRWRSWIRELWQLINKVINNAIEKKIPQETALEKLDPLKKYCIIPAKCKDRQFLYPLKDAKCVLQPHKPHASLLFGSVYASLIGAGIPELEHSILEKPYIKTSVELPKDIVSHLEDPRGILQALWSLLQQEPSATEFRKYATLSRTASILLEYLARYFKDNCTEKEKCQLRDLPIHQLVNGQVTELKSCSIYIVPAGIPKAGLDNWYSQSSTTTERFIFKLYSDADALYSRIGCVEMTEVDLYVELILKEVNFLTFLTHKERWEHLKYIRDHVLPQLPKHSKKYLAIMASLQILPFMQNEEGSFLKASEFFDSRITLFKAMETNLLPKELCTEVWVTFLALCGLRAEVTDQDILKYAKRVEEEARAEPADVAWLICKAMETLVDINQSVLFQLKNIAFLPCSKVPSQYSSMHSQFGISNPSEMKFISFQDSILYQDCDYCWTVANILPPWLKSRKLEEGHIELRNDHLKKLGVQYPVPLQMTVVHCMKLVKHLSNNNLKRTEKERKDVVSLLNRLYERMDKEARDHRNGKEALKQLKDAPCIWVDEGDSLVYPKQVVCHLESWEKISSYLYQLPKDLYCYMKMFEEIGVEEKPTHTHFMMVLQMMKKECMNEELDANRLNSASIATWNCLPHLMDCKEKPEIPLYLLSRKKTLENSAELVVVDKPSWDTERISGISLPLLLVPDNYYCQCMEYLSGMPEALRPRNLSSIVEEVMDAEMVCEASFQESSNPFKSPIESEEFMAGLQRILVHDMMKRVTSIERRVGPQSLYSRKNINHDKFDEQWCALQTNVRSIEFCTVDKLETVLKYKDGDVLPGSRTGSHTVFIKKIESGGCKVFVPKSREASSADCLANYDVLNAVLEIITEIFTDIGMQATVQITRIWGTPRKEISITLDRCGLPKGRFKQKNALLPRPGSYIPLEKHWILKPDFQRFFKGDFVGLEVGDPLNDGEEGCATYIYAQVVEVLTCDGTIGDLFRKYKIDIGEPQDKIVFSSKMYKVSSAKELTADEDPVDDIIYDIKRIRSQISADLEFAFHNLEADDRKLVVKRLVMKWQKESHPGHEAFCEEILGFIDEKIRQIQAQMDSSETSASHTPSGELYSVQHIADFAAQRNKERRQQVQEHRMRLAVDGASRAGGGDPTHFNYYSRSGRNPQPGEARRWYRQAEADLNASRNDQTGRNDAYEWALYKCHQASEKALKAAYFMKDSNRFMDHDLLSVAGMLDDAMLTSLAGEIAAILGDGVQLRYPDRLLYSQIPHDLYGRDTYDKVYELSKNLLESVKCQYLNG